MKPSMIYTRLLETDNTDVFESELAVTLGVPAGKFKWSAGLGLGNFCDRVSGAGHIEVGLSLAGSVQENLPWSELGRVGRGDIRNLELEIAPIAGDAKLNARQGIGGRVRIEKAGHHHFERKAPGLGRGPVAAHADSALRQD